MLLQTLSAAIIIYRLGSISPLFSHSHYHLSRYRSPYQLSLEIADSFCRFGHQFMNVVFILYGILHLQKGNLHGLYALNKWLAVVAMPSICVFSYQIVFRNQSWCAFYYSWTLTHLDRSSKISKREVNSNTILAMMIVHINVQSLRHRCKLHNTALAFVQRLHV